jgi:hypothetical protein
MISGKDTKIIGSIYCSTARLDYGNMSSGKLYELNRQYIL